MNVKPTFGTPVHLLADEDVSSAQAHRQTTSRSGAFIGRGKDVPSFADGSIHVEQPRGRHEQSIFGGWRGLSLEQLYTSEYLPYIQHEKERARRTQARPLPPTPDFDTDMLTNSDAVATYVQSMASIFHRESHTAPPSALRLLEQLTLEACHAVEDANANVENVTNHSGTPTRSSSLSAVDVQVDSYNDENITGDEAGVNDSSWLAAAGDVSDIVLGAIEPHPFLSGDALALSLALVDIVSQRRRSIEVLLERVIETPTAARTLPRHAVETALDALEAALSAQHQAQSGEEQVSSAESVSPLTDLVYQCEFVGAVICARDFLSETLRYVNVLELLTQLDGGDSPFPWAPRLVENIAQTALDEWSDTLRPSPFRGYEEPPVAVVLPINSRMRAEHICISRDRKQLTVVAATGLSMFSLATPKPSFLHSAEFPASASGAPAAAPWCSMYSSDNLFFIVTNEHGTVHTVYDASSAVQHGQIITDSIRVPLDYKDGVLLTMPAPTLPCCSRSSLLLYREDGAPALVSKQIKEPVAADTCLVSCLLGFDFEGTFLTLQTDVTTLSLTISESVLTITDGSVRSYTALPPLHKWTKLVVQWKEYVPHITVNGHSLGVKGEHTVRRQPIQVRSVSCCEGSCSGHVGDISVHLRGCQQWSGQGSTNNNGQPGTAPSRVGTTVGSTASRTGVSASLSGADFSARSFPSASATNGTMLTWNTSSAHVPGVTSSTSATLSKTKLASATSSADVCVLFHLPLDEGTGLWVKEMAARRGCSLALGRVQWDRSLPVPRRSGCGGAGTGAVSSCAETRQGGKARSISVRVDEAKLLQSRVVVSDQHVYFMWPPKTMAEQGLVVQVMRSSGVIREVYNCAGVGRDAYTTLLPDESGYYVLQHPLNTTTFVGLHVPSARQLELARMARELHVTTTSPNSEGTSDGHDVLHDGRSSHRDPVSPASIAHRNLNETPHTSGTFLRALYQMLYGWAPVLESAHGSGVPVTPSTLTRLVRLFEMDAGAKSAHQDPSRPAALVALATVHVRALPQQDVIAVAASLTASAQYYREQWRSVPVLRRAAEALATATTLKCVSVRDLAAALFQLDDPVQQRLLSSCVSEHNLTAIMRVIAEEEEDERVVSLVDKLLDVEQKAAASALSEEPDTGDDGRGDGLPFGVSAPFSCGTRGLFCVLAALVTALRDAGRRAVIAKLVKQRLDCAVATLKDCNAAVPSTLDEEARATSALDISAREEDQPILSMMTNGVVPLLLVVRQLCPLIVGAENNIEEDLIELLQLASVRCVSPSAPQALPSTSHLPDDDRVRFAFREMIEVAPTNERADATWRVEMDYHGATTVTLLKSASSGAMTAVHVPLHEGESRRFDMPVGEGSTVIDGGALVLFGKGPTSFSVIACFNLSVQHRDHMLLRETIIAVLMAYVDALVHQSTQPSPATATAEAGARLREIYVPAMLRGGLTTRVLESHGIDLPGRSEHLPAADEVLNDVGEGKLLVDYTFSLMRASILPSMRPAVRALLCLLVASGASTHQAAEELKHLWFSGEWGSKLQGVTREHTTRQLTDLAKWMTQSVHYNIEAAVETFRRTSMTERRMEASLNESRSISEGRNSVSVTSRRGAVHYADTLEQVHTLLANGVTPTELEETLVARTRSTLHHIAALQLLVKIVSIPCADAAQTTVGPVVDTLVHLSDHTFAPHNADTLSGAGYELECRLRGTYHTLLGKCLHVLSAWQEQHSTSRHAVHTTDTSSAEPFAKRPPAKVPLLEAAPVGRHMLSLFGLLCHPWDLDDCELFAKNLSNEESIVLQLEKPLAALTHHLIDYSTVTAPTDAPVTAASDVTTGAPLELLTDGSNPQGNPLAAIDLASLSRPFPNGFSVVIPQVQTSTSADGTVLKKSSPKTTIICADKEWPLVWRDGLPNMFYFEVRLQSASTETAVGLSLNARQKDLTVFYADTGDTHEAALPAFHNGDVVGCGVLPVTGQVLLTLNGRLLLVSAAPKKVKSVLPSVRLGQASQVIVNFGTAPFAFDGRCLHAALDTEKGPSQYMVSSMAGVTLHCVTSRVCLAHEMRRDSVAKGSLRHHCCVAVCDAVKKVTASLLQMNSGGDASAPRRGEVNQLVAFSAAEHMVILFIATIRRVVHGSPRALSAFTQNESERLFETVSLLMLFPLHSIQVATLSLLAEVVQCVQTVKESAAQHLVDVLFEYAMATHSEAESTAMVPFIPRWTDCDTRFMSITSSKTATMLPEAQRSAVLGAPLPRTGTVSFSVRITRSNMHKGHSLKGGYFIGVAVAGLTPLSPSSNSQSWKSVKPPVVWALHDISPQLAYATNPTVKPNNFQRTFGHADVICVVVDRDRGTVDFFRENEYLARLFSDVPNDVDIVPFAQLYNDDAEAHLIGGEMTAPLTAATLLSSVSVDVLRCMLTLEPFEALVARRLCKEMDQSPFPRVSLMVFNSLPDPRLLRLPSSLIESGTEIKVTRLVGLECKYNLDGEAHFEYLHNMRRSSRLKITCSIAPDVNGTNASLHGLRMCVSKLVSAARQLAVPLITTQALCYLEGEARQGILDEEKEHWAFLFHGVRVNSFKSVRDEIARSKALGRAVFDPPGFERTYVFSASLSHPGFSFSRYSRYQLATVPSENKNMIAPYIAIAEPAIPSSGTFSIRCQLMRGSSGQILGGGYYFGVCTSALTWSVKDLCNNTVNVWAIHDMEDTPWRLRHLLPTATFPVVVEPRCIIVSGDIIRLEVNRTTGTMSAYRKPVGAPEMPLGQIYENLPAGPLYPFVHLFNTDAVAVLLPPNTEELAVRLTVPKPVYSVVDLRTRRFCDGCYALHHECRLTEMWYKCNVCADYALCKSCYDLFVHSKHTFTEMGEGSMVHSRRAPREFTVGMPVVVSTSPCVYLRSAACRLEEDDIWTTAQAVDENGLVLWGLTRTARTQFSITIESTDGEPLSLDSPTFVGVGVADDVLPLTRKNMRAWCHSLAKEQVCVSNDPTLHSPMHRESRSPYGFQSGDTLSFEVNLATSSVTVFRNWVALGTCQMHARRATGVGTVPLVCFVAFGRPNIKATLFSEGPATTLARIEDVKGYVVRAVTKSGQCVVVSKENCRLPLMPLSDLLPMVEAQGVGLPTDRSRWPLGYTFVNNHMMQARLEHLETSEATQAHLSILETGESLIVPSQCFLVNESGALALDSLARSGLSRAVWPSMKNCFVLSRYLLILSCLCESDMLSPLVTSLGSDIIGILKGLASVQISKDAATDFLTDIRNTVALTAGWASYRGSEVWKTAMVGGGHSGSGVWGVKGDGGSGVGASNGHRSGGGGIGALTFVPTLGTEERRRRYRHGLLVHLLDVDRTLSGDGVQSGHLGSGTVSTHRGGKQDAVYRVQERRGDVLSLCDIVTGDTLERNFRQCVPLKQCAGVPWHLKPNSVPCSLLEHSMRVRGGGSGDVPHNAAAVLTLAGTWEGSATVGEGRSVSFRLNLTSSWAGTALFNFPVGSGDDAVPSPQTASSTTTLHAIYHHHRLERTVTIYAIPPSIAHTVLDGVILGDANRYEEARAAIVAFMETDTGEGGSHILLLRATLDYDGTRMDGIYKKGDEHSAAFHAKLRHHAPLVSATTRERHVEPLPSCTDAVLTPPRHREPPEVMHRLVVLLAHHLYLVLCSHSYVSWHELESTLLLNDHPLTRQLVGSAIGAPQLLQLVTDAANLIHVPKVKAWEAATLARLLTESFLLRVDVLNISPIPLVWDALHAVVATAHRCGEYCRHELVTHVTAFLRSHEGQLSPEVLQQLLALLITQLSSSVTCPSAFAEASRDSSALMELVLASPPLIQSSIHNLSLDPLKCLVAVWHSLSDGSPLPRAVECSSGNECVAESPVQTECVFGDYDADVLKVGKVVSGVSAPANARSYYEVVLPEHVPSQFSVGWGTPQHKEVPSQHVGSDAASFGFNGTDILSPKGRQEYRISSEPGTATVIGCLLDLTEHTVAWSMNGYQGPPVPLPISLKGNVLFAFVSIGACKGMTIRMRAEQFEYDPDGYTDLSGRRARPLIRNFDPREASNLPVQPLAFYWQLASYLSDTEDQKSPGVAFDREASMVSNNMSACTPMRSASISSPAPKYPLLRLLSVFELNDYTHVIEALESCMTTASHYVDLDGDAITGQLSQSFVFLKRFVRRQFRRKLVSMHMQYPEKRQPSTAVTISLTELYSTLPRSPEVALQHTVLAQLHRQIGLLTDAQWMSTPLFLVHLFTTESGQAPTDAGGPYRQVWTCLADEIMTHPDRCFPHTEFHRNPLFVFVNNSQRLTLVPDTYASSPYELTLFQFFGKLMGYAARSKTPCAVDLSPFLWKFLVDDTLTIRDYYTHVNSVVEKSMEDDDFLSSGVAEDVIPGFQEQIEWPKEEGLSEKEVVETRRRVAEECLIHSMDRQLKAIQTGLWSTLPRRVARCLSWSELETLVCGTADPSVTELRQCIRLNLTGPRQKYFWQILSEMTSEQKSNLLCFASGQKRLPLIRLITVSETNESVDHLPRAQSCFSIITLPKYPSYEMFKEKLLLALSHQTEMDLA